jgi:hypothetical protein
MSSTALDRYLGELATELRHHEVTDPRIVEEAREHLVDAIDAGQRRGLSHAAAEFEALERFGPAASVASAFAKERGRALNAVVLAVSIAVGIAIAYVDSRPTWDDTGITVLTLIGAAGICGLIAPRRPWVYALGVGFWIPLHAIARARRPSSAIMLVTLAFPLVGAYAGTFVRKVFFRMTHESA